MRTSVFLSLLLVLPYVIIAQTKTPVKKAAPAQIKKTAPAPAPQATHPPEPDYKKLGGIAFMKEPIDTVFARAKKVGKPVFVEIYSPDCHTCQSFMPILAGKKVGDVYNQYFVSKKLDLMQKPTQEWLEKKKLYIPSIPMFLFFDADGNLLHATMTNNGPDEINGRAAAALDPRYRSQQYPDRFAAGERGADFLIEYGLFTKIVKDTTANSRVMEEYAKQQPVTEYANGTNWLVLQKVIMDYTNPIAQHLINNQAAYKQYGEGTAREVAENLLLSSLYSPQAARFAPEKVQQIREQLVKIGVDPKVANARTLMQEVNAYIYQNKTSQAAARMDKHVNEFPLSAPEFLYVAHFFNANSKDGSDVPSTIKWLEKALALPKLEPAEKADLYFELADAYKRGNQAQEALKAANSSLTVAQAAKLNTKKYTEQVDKLK